MFIIECILAVPRKLTEQMKQFFFLIEREMQNVYTYNAKKETDNLLTFKQIKDLWRNNASSSKASRHRWKQL